MGFAVVSVLLFTPMVSVRELQRKDRLPEQGQFVDQAYRYLLGRAADAAGLVEYEARYEQAGPEAVIVALVSSREFRDRYPAGGLPPLATNSNEVFTPTDAVDFGRQYVELYRSGLLQARPTGDWVGRVGFVLLLALAAIAIIVFQRTSSRPVTGQALYTYLPRAYIVTLFSVLAVVWWLNSQVLFYSFVPGAFGYAEWLDRVTSLSIARSVTSVWTPYPQGTQMVLVALESLATGLAGWLHSDVWTSYTIFRCLFQAVFLLVPSIVVVSVVYSIGAMISPQTATFASSIVAFSFAPVYYGVSSTLVTDPLPVMLTVLGIWFCALKKPGWAALALGVGAVLKLIPAVLLVPAVVLATNNRSRWRLVLVSAAVIVCVLVPFFLANPEFFWSPFRWQAGRPAWQSWYAFLNWLVGAPHDFTSPAFEDLGFGHDFGWVFWGITPPLTSLIAAVPSNPLRWENIVSVLGTIGSLSVVFAARSGGPRAMARWSMYALAVTFFWSVGWSPQYELYLVAVAALCFEAPLVGIGVVLALEVVTFLEYPLFLPWAYFYGGSAVWLAWGATVARYLLLAWLAVFVIRSEADMNVLRKRSEWLTGICDRSICSAVTKVRASSPRRRR